MHESMNSRHWLFISYRNEVWVDLSILMTLACRAVKETWRLRRKEPRVLFLVTGSQWKEQDRHECVHRLTKGTTKIQQNKSLDDWAREHEEKGKILKSSTGIRKSRIQEDGVDGEKCDSELCEGELAALSRWETQGAWGHCQIWKVG